MNKLPAEKLNDFIDKIIEPRLVKNERICDANGILDWLMQKGWSKTLTYTSYPDRTVHTVKEGLKQVFDTIQELNESIRIIRALYNNELYEMYKRLDTMPNAEDEEKIHKLKEIMNLIKQL